MTSSNLVGLILALLGLLIFFFFIFKSSFKQYAGIREYKRIREKFLVNKRENAAEEIEAFNEADLIDDSDGIEKPEVNSSLLVGTIGRLVGAMLGLYVFSQIINAIDSQLMGINSSSMMSDAFIGPMTLIKMTIPIIAIMMMFGVLYPLMVAMNLADEKETVGINEYKKTRKKYTVNKRKNAAEEIKAQRGK